MLPPLLFPWPRSGSPTFFHSRIATVPSPTNFGSMTLFLIYATAHRNYPRILYLPCFLCDSSSLDVFAPSTPAYTFRFAHRTVFAVFCVCCFVLARVPCFFACQFSRNYPRQFFRGGAFLHSGFTFSHYDLTFPTRYCIPFVRFGLYQLVICVKGIRVCALNCVRAVTSIRIAF